VKRPTFLSQSREENLKTVVGYDVQTLNEQIVLVDAYYGLKQYKEAAAILSGEKSILELLTRSAMVVNNDWIVRARYLGISVRLHWKQRGPPPIVFLASGIGI
jgi:hypothetical protein